MCVCVCVAPGRAQVGVLVDVSVGVAMHLCLLHTVGVVLHMETRAGHTASTLALCLASDIIYPVGTGFFPDQRSWTFVDVIFMSRNTHLLSNSTSQTRLWS